MRHVSPLQSGFPEAVRSEAGVASTGKLQRGHRLPPACSKDEDDEEEEETSPTTTAPTTSPSHRPSAATPPECGALCSGKFVGDRLPAGVKARDVLRKKFSWKSFPELEVYLVDHRPKYLACSNSLNYTKAQKQYNNDLTQGLLDLAAAEGYLFESFTFAAVRDRIRCFYKSFVQATKKKKRLKTQKRGRSVTLSPLPCGGGVVVKNHRGMHVK